MSEEEILSYVKNYALENSEDNDIHGFPHVERVYNLCLQIGKKLGANLFLLKIAAYLHDVGRIRVEDTKDDKNHAEYSAEIALNLLKSYEYIIPQTDLENIIHMIRAHSFSNNVVPKTLEAKILSDADKLDALGAIGLYRTIGFTLQRGGDLDNVVKHFESKIMKLKDLMHLDLTKQIANDRQEIILEFYNKIKEEK
ncbi:MAG: HD domain-containing protein [Candidatus Lokiarchaeota archaeon]|nr:HD domain-containing protein [Candidatus Lokiarchaeota archaeon]